MSDELVVIVPTRGRPAAVAPMARAFADTSTDDIWLVWCVDGDPTNEDRYRAEVAAARAVFPWQSLYSGPRRRLVGTLNHYARVLTAPTAGPTAIAYLGDDHRPVTYGWDTAYKDALDALGTGIVYGDDGHQGANLPTQMAMSADIVRVLGHVAPPVLTHMYCDNYWKDLGDGADCLTYLPDVQVIHHHPGTGNGVWDASYRESNSAARYAADRAAYERYRASDLRHDIDRVRSLREGPR